MVQLLAQPIQAIEVEMVVLAVVVKDIPATLLQEQEELELRDSDIMGKHPLVFTTQVVVEVQVPLVGQFKLAKEVLVQYQL